MKFTVKKSLIGIAALSLLAPVASHADTTTVPTIKDGFNNRTKDGRGSKCVAHGGTSQALGSDCMSEAEAMNAKAEAEAAARKAAKAESDAAAKAAAQAARDEALLAKPPGSGLRPGQKGAYVAQGSASRMIRDGYGRSCIKDGLWDPTMASEECDPELYSLYNSKRTEVAQSDLAPRIVAAPPEVEREMVEPQSELAPRLPYTAQEAVRPAAVAAVAAGAAAVTAAAVGADEKPEAVATDTGVAAEQEETSSDAGLSDSDASALAAGAAGVGIVAAVAADEDDEAEEAAAQDDYFEEEETTPDMMMSDADRALAEDGEFGLLAAAAVAVAVDDDEDADDDDLPGDDGEDQDTTPDMMMSEEDRRLPDDDVVLLSMVPTDDDDDDDDDDEDGGNLDDDIEEEETTPDMMLLDVDRTLPGEDVTLLAAIAEDEDEDEDDDVGERAGDDDGDETTPDMMMSDADRMLAGDDDKSPGAAVLTDTSPGVAPAPEKKVESKPVIDNKVPDFPVTKYEVEKAQAQAPKPAPSAASLPVTINAQDGLFDFDRADLKSDLIAKLDSVADMLRESKVDAVSIVGHADPIGSAEYNQTLSLRRAESAKRYLVGKGIDAKRISASGVGEQDLVVARADCADKRKDALIDCLQPNRRVVVDIAGAMAAK